MSVRSGAVRGHRYLRWACTLVSAWMLAVACSPADAQAASWSPASSMTTARVAHTATRLANGKVLVAGGGAGLFASLASAELYDPASNTWSSAGSMSIARSGHTATLLAGGKILVTGGASGRPATASAELYDPASNTWSSAGSLSTARYRHTATLLQDGSVLVAGGNGGFFGSGPTASAELYDPASNTWSSGQAMSTARDGLTASPLADGTVLVAGGYTPTGPATSAELYDPASNTWTSAAGMTTARYQHTATPLRDGRVLVIGGFGDGGDWNASAESYDPASDAWSSTASRVGPSAVHETTSLADGRVLVTGGVSDGAPDATVELYDALSGAWSSAERMTSGRYGHAATLLASGDVLVSGGVTESDLSASAELFTPASGGEAVPITPGGAPSWSLTRRAPAKVTRRRGQLHVATGYVAANPPGGPSCTGPLTLKTLRSRSTGELIPVFLTGKVARVPLPPGTARRITFRLNARGARLLRRLGSLTAILRGALRCANSGPIVHKATLRLHA